MRAGMLLKGIFIGVDINNNFELMLKRLSPTLKRITYKLNGHFSFFNEEDLYQEALLHLWQDFRNKKLEDKTDSYILQGCYFHLKNHIRKVKGRNKTTSLEAIINEEGATLQEALSLEYPNHKDYLDSLNNRLFAETISNNGLSGREKDILSSYSEGLTIREIGKRLGISHVMVLRLTARIRNKCKKYLDLC